MPCSTPERELGLLRTGEGRQTCYPQPHPASRKITWKTGSEITGAWQQLAEVSHQAGSSRSCLSTENQQRKFKFRKVKEFLSMNKNTGHQISLALDFTQVSKRLFCQPPWGSGSQRWTRGGKVADLALQKSSCCTSTSVLKVTLIVRTYILKCLLR